MENTCVLTCLQYHQEINTDHGKTVLSHGKNIRLSGSDCQFSPPENPEKRPDSAQFWKAENWELFDKISLNIAWIPAPKAA
jgi:hypothetical protein